MTEEELKIITSWGYTKHPDTDDWWDSNHTWVKEAELLRHIEFDKEHRKRMLDLLWGDKRNT